MKSPPLLVHGLKFAVLNKLPYRIHKLQTLMASGGCCIINGMWLNLSHLLLNPMHMLEIMTSRNC